MTRLNFEVIAQSGRARRARLATRRGEFATPVFMPVGTQGTVKSLLPEEVSGLGAEIILGNTYHLMLRPGDQVVNRMGGLHRFMGWEKSILTDSGGFQVFSLANRREMAEEGVVFRSHLDGSQMELTPERAVKAQENLGSDIMMMLDECPPAGAGHSYIERALLRDARWGQRALAARGGDGGALMGIVQGGVYPELRAKSAGLICSQDFDGFALGGLSVGEPKEQMMEVIDRTIDLLPADKPRYLMGVGKPEDLVACSALGVDMFDCVLPTRMARNGGLFTSHGVLNIRNARYKEDQEPVEEGCGCPACRKFSRAYLRHLLHSRELLAYRLNTLHNLYYILRLMENMRRAIAEDRFAAFAADFFGRLEQGEAHTSDDGGNDV